MCLELEPLALKTRLSEAVTVCLTLDVAVLRVYDTQARYGRKWEPQSLQKLLFPCDILFSASAYHWAGSSLTIYNNWLQYLCIFSTYISLVNRNIGVRVYCRGRARSSFSSVAVHRSERVASGICELSGVSMGDSQRQCLSCCPWKAVFLSRIFFSLQCTNLYWLSVPSLILLYPNKTLGFLSFIVFAGEKNLFVYLHSGLKWVVLSYQAKSCASLSKVLQEYPVLLTHPSI